MENLLTLNIMTDFSYGFVIGSVCAVSTIGGIIILNGYYPSIISSFSGIWNNNNIISDIESNLSEDNNTSPCASDGTNIFPLETTTSTGSVSTITLDYTGPEKSVQMDIHVGVNESIQANVEVSDKSVFTESIMNNSNLTRLKIPLQTINQVNTNPQTAISIQSAIPIPIPYNEPLMVPIISKLEDNVFIIRIFP